jgi:DNA-binding IclR family transcriptional regulator
MMKEGKSYRVPALKRAFGILDLIRSSAYGRTVAELSKLLDLPYSTTFYLLKTMEEYGFLRRDPDSRKFYLGGKLVSYHASMSQSEDLRVRDAASPYLARLVDEFGSTAHTAIRQDEEAVYVDKKESHSFLKINTWIGQHVPLHCTAVGKSLLLLSKPDEIIAIFQNRELTRFTDRTIVKVKDLIKHLQTYSNMGYTIDDREAELEGACAASPIINSERRVVAAIGLSGTVYQLPPAKWPEIGTHLRESAEEISRELGFSGEFPWHRVLATVK